MFAGREREEWSAEETARVLQVVAEHATLCLPLCVRGSAESTAGTDVRVWRCQGVVLSVCSCIRGMLSAIEDKGTLPAICLRACYAVSS
eukprot:721689-Rhodomonas_salina.1